MSEKTEQPTSYKLQKAKEKGQVSKSVELTSCISLLVILTVLSALWPKQLQEIKSLFRHLLYMTAHIHINLDLITHLFQFILSELISLWLPLALASVLAIILGTIAQTGIILSATPLIPDFKRLNIVQGFKKLFTLKTCFEALKSALKLILAFILVCGVINYQLPDLLQLIGTKPVQYPELMMSFLLKLILQLLMLLSAIAIIDKFYTVWKFKKDNRMSKQEVKDEYRQKEGDPKIKAKIRQLQQQLRQKTASLAEVKTADVVITNPTHLAVALKYERGIMPAPKVVCKAKGELVAEVKKLARMHGVPLLEHKAFARMLYQTIELNHWISKDLYPIAAGIFRDIYALRDKA
jgi:flagellar biosynthesis protein FlhB